MRARRAKRNPLLPVGGADESLAGCLHYRDGSRWASEDRRLRGLSAACSDTGPREPRLSDRYSRPSACAARTSSQKTGLHMEQYHWLVSERSGGESEFCPNFMNHEGHEVAQRLNSKGFPSWAFVVKSGHYRKVIGSLR